MKDMDRKLAELIREANSIKEDISKLEQRFNVLVDKIVALAPNTSMPTVDTPIKSTQKSVKTQTKTVNKDNIIIGRRKYRISELLDALRLNNLSLMEELRDSLAKIARQPNEKEILAELISAGIPGVILTGTPKAAIIDGSNIAQMASQRAGKLAYIDTTKSLAHKGGYFPVITIIDASLRHNIDNSLRLEDMMRSGEIVMAPPYTSADELIISEARRLDAVVLTNDRFADWPAAKSISKRHVSINGTTLSLGDFHRATSFWFR